MWSKLLDIVQSISQEYLNNFIIDRSVVIPSVSELAELLLCGCMTILRNPSQIVNSTVIPLFHAIPPPDPWPSSFAIIYCASSVVEKVIQASFSAH